MIFPLVVEYRGLLRTGIWYKHLMTLPLIAAEAYFFFLDKKETKNQVSRNASLRTGPFQHKSEKTTGWNIFAE
jgi:hypothetical protein